ncbi:MAG: hypothetical protein ACE365_03145 [Gammaproteobacteria bacterium]
MNFSRGFVLLVTLLMLILISSITIVLVENNTMADRLNADLCPKCRFE